MAGEMTITVTFEEVPGWTEVTVHQEDISETIPSGDGTVLFRYSLYASRRSHSQYLTKHPRLAVSEA